MASVINAKEKHQHSAGGTSTSTQHSPLSAAASCFTLSLLQEEQQKIKKKKKSIKKKPVAVEEPQKHSQDSSSPEATPDSEGNAADQEYGSGTVKIAGGSQPMAPGVFLNQRRPSTSSPNNASAQPAKVERGNSTDAKGKLKYLSSDVSHFLRLCAYEQKVGLLVCHFSAYLLSCMLGH